MNFVDVMKKDFANLFKLAGSTCTRVALQEAL